MHCKFGKAHRTLLVMKRVHAWGCVGIVCVCVHVRVYVRLYACACAHTPCCPTDAAVRITLCWSSLCRSRYKIFKLNCCSCYLSVERACASVVLKLATMSEHRFNTQCAVSTCTACSMRLFEQPTSTPSQTDRIPEGFRPSKLPLQSAEHTCAPDAVSAARKVC